MSSAILPASPQAGVVCISAKLYKKSSYRLHPKRGTKVVKSKAVARDRAASTASSLPRIVRTRGPRAKALVAKATYKVTLKMAEAKKEVTIDCEGNEYILKAAEDEGIELPYDCRSGNCTSCVAKVISGNVDNEEQDFLTDDQVNNGFILTCTAYPQSDMVVETHQEKQLY